MDQLLHEIRGCVICVQFLPEKPRPIIQAGPDSKILIVGQAPGKKEQQSGIPWDDPSGIELRRWLGVCSNEFYDQKNFALVPMGFCYPGKGKSGDLPPRPECAPLCHTRLRSEMKKARLTILIGSYFHLPASFNRQINALLVIFMFFAFPLLKSEIKAEPLNDGITYRHHYAAGFI